MNRAARVLVVGCVLLGWSAALRAATDCPHQAPATQRYQRSIARYAVPEVTLVDQDATPVALRSLLHPDGGVALTFVFTSCNTICPVLTSTLSRMRRELGDDGKALRLVSISIDPERDTPAVLREYATRFDAGTEWRLLTGDGGDVLRVLKAFDAYAGPKTNHQPLAFLRAPGGTDWVRIQGFATAAEMADEYRRLRTE